MSDSALDLKGHAYHSSLFSLSFSLTSPAGIGAESDLESILMRGANDSMACLLTSPR
jgi:hypothetical protein